MLEEKPRKEPEKIFTEQNNFKVISVDHFILSYKFFFLQSPSIWLTTFIHDHSFIIRYYNHQGGVILNHLTTSKIGQNYLYTLFCLKNKKQYVLILRNFI